VQFCQLGHVHNFWFMGLKLVPTSAAIRRKLPRRKDAQKSRIANGSALLPGVDGRSTWVRRCKEMIADHVSDLGGDVSTAEHALIRRAAVLVTELERLELRFALADQPETTDLDLYQKLTNTLRRLLQSLGLQRRSKDISALPTLSQYLASREAAE
jgi:hypothetical protein